jgi:carotenoid 1,2-hydratase
MPTIPLYTSPSDPNAPREVRRPGGYEWWYFDAEDRGTDRQIVVMFFDACPFDPRYVREYHRYLRHPTRFRPPLPSSFPCTYLAFHQGDKLVARFVERSSALPAAPSGEQRISFVRGSFEVQLTFRPRWLRPAVERTLLEHHHWVLVNPLCDVAGMIRLNRDSIPFTGRGFRDHHWGKAAPSATMRRWVFGRVLREDSVLAFQEVKSHRNATVSAVVELGEAGDREDLGISVESMLQASALEIDRSIFHRRCKRDATLVHVVHPHRLAWPFVNQMLERRMRNLKSEI